LRRLGYDCPQELALTAAKVATGLCAQAKGKSLGILPPSEKKPEERRKAAEQRRLKPSVTIAGMNLTVASQPGDKAELRACSNGKPLDPAQVDRYLHSTFKTDLEAVRTAMQAAASKRRPKELPSSAIQIYEKFRPGKSPTSQWRP